VLLMPVVGFVTLPVLSILYLLLFGLLDEFLDVADDTTVTLMRPTFL
jgi:hypothetical protein